MSLPADLESAAATLYAGAREGFISARNALAKQAKAAEHTPLAAAIAALPKPLATAWAVDRVWWEAPACIRELFAAAGELRASLVAGGGTHGTEPARARHRAALLAATTRAAGFLPSVSIATRRRLTTTLEALAALGRWPPPGPGCLAADLDPPGFESLGAMPTLVPAIDDAESSANDDDESSANDDDDAADAAAADAAAADAAAAALRCAEVRLQVCREQHDALVVVHREAHAATVQAASALARAQAHHVARIAAEQGCLRDLGQRSAEFEAARAAHHAARAALVVLRRAQ